MAWAPVQPQDVVRLIVPVVQQTVKHDVAAHVRRLLIRIYAAVISQHSWLY